jgi:hypothetical protein
MCESGLFLGSFLGVMDWSQKENILKELTN